MRVWSQDAGYVWGRRAAIVAVALRIAGMGRAGAVLLFAAALSVAGCGEAPMESREKNGFAGRALLRDVVGGVDDGWSFRGPVVMTVTLAREESGVVVLTAESSRVRPQEIVFARGSCADVAQLDPVMLLHHEDEFSQDGANESGRGGRWWFRLADDVSVVLLQPPQPIVFIVTQSSFVGDEFLYEACGRLQVMDEGRKEP